MEGMLVYAVIQAGGRQVKVSEGDVIEMEKMQNAHPGDPITFSNVSILGDGDNFSLGTPWVERATVFGIILDVFRAPKILVFKKKRRKQYRRTRGHRQHMMRVRIDEMGLYNERRKSLEHKPEEHEAVRSEAPGPAVEAASERIDKVQKGRRRLQESNKRPKTAASKKSKAAASKKETGRSKTGRTRESKRKKR